MVKLGISACFMYPDPGRPVFGKKTLNYLENDMARYLAQEGILPVLIPDLEKRRLMDILEQMDGFVLQGGNDLAPETYGEEPIMGGKWKGDAYRDQYEFRIMDYALEAQKPVLGICRGLQLMNVYFGGSLYQDTVIQCPAAISHRDAALYDRVSHGIQLVKGKILDQVYEGDQNRRVNSVHHQSIKRLGNNLEVLATCPEDGTIEAIGYTGKGEGEIMAVQWHPEFSDSLRGKVLDPQVLLNVFLNHVKRSKNENH